MRKYHIHKFGDSLLFSTMILTYLLPNIFVVPALILLVVLFYGVEPLLRKGGGKWIGPRYRFSIALVLLFAFFHQDMLSATAKYFGMPETLTIIFSALVVFAVRFVEFPWLEERQETSSME